MEGLVNVVRLSEGRKAWDNKCSLYSFERIGSFGPLSKSEDLLIWSLVHILVY